MRHAARQRMKAQAVGTYVPKLLQRAFEKQGFAQIDILARWPDIVGADLARDTRPMRLKYVHDRRRRGSGPAAADGGSRHGVLTVRADGPAALELQHLAPQVIERINIYYGHGAVGRLQVTQGPVTRKPERRPRAGPRLTEEEAGRLRKAVGQVTHPPLNAALERLGAWIIGKNHDKGGSQRRMKAADKPKK